MKNKHTKRNRAKSDSKISAAVLKALFDCIPDGIIMYNEQGIVEDINDSCCSLLGSTKEELVGKYITHFLIKQNNYAPIELSEFVTAKNWRPVYLKQKNDTFLPAEAIVKEVLKNKYLLIINNNAIANLRYDDISQKLEELQFSKDLLEERSAELNILSAQLAQSELELKELNASKDKFFSILAHDLKSPFSGLAGYMDLLVDDFDGLSLPEIKEYIMNIRTTVINIYNLTKNLLDWSRLQNGRMKCEIIKLNLYEIVLYATSLVSANAHNKDISIINNTDINASVFADEMMINSVIENLLSNAIKFTPRGGKITISSRPMNIFHEISIADTGIGMSKKTLEKIFKIESIHTTPGTEQEKGTGLGLILCKEMIERQKGAISVESKENEGTRFSFILPSADEDETDFNTKNVFAGTAKYDRN